MTAVAALRWLAAFLAIGALTFLTFAALVWVCLALAYRRAGKVCEQ